MADATKTAKRQVRTAARASQQQLKEAFVSGEDAVHAAQLELASECGSSAWLTSRPQSCHGFRLSKPGFRDALCLRYGWVRSVYRHPAFVATRASKSPTRYPA